MKVFTIKLSKSHSFEFVTHNDAELAEYLENEESGLVEWLLAEGNGWEIDGERLSNDGVWELLQDVWFDDVARVAKRQVKKGNTIEREMR